MNNQRHMNRCVMFVVEVGVANEKLSFKQYIIQIRLPDIHELAFRIVTHTVTGIAGAL